MQSRAPSRLTARNRWRYSQSTVRSRSSFIPPKMAALLTRKSIPPKLLDGRFGHRRGRLGIGHVHPHRLGRAAAGADAVGHLGGVVLVDVGHHHRGPGGGQALGVGLPDAPARPVTMPPCR